MFWSVGRRKVLDVFIIVETWNDHYDEASVPENIYCYHRHIVVVKSTMRRQSLALAHWLDEFLMPSINYITCHKLNVLDYYGFYLPSFFSFPWV